MLLTPSSNMARTRLFIGLTSVSFGLCAILFATGGVATLMKKGTWEDWTWPIALISFGGLMAFAAVHELYGERRRLCRVFSSFMLGCVWIAVFFQSFEDGAPDALTIHAPLYILFCAWAWIQDSATQRKTSISRGTLS